MLLAFDGPENVLPNISNNFVLKPTENYVEVFGTFGLTKVLLTYKCEFLFESHSFKSISMRSVWYSRKKKFSAIQETLEKRITDTNKQLGI